MKSPTCPRFPWEFFQFTLIRYDSSSFRRAKSLRSNSLPYAECVAASTPRNSKDPSAPTLAVPIGIPPQSSRFEFNESAIRPILTESGDGTLNLPEILNSDPSLRGSGEYAACGGNVGAWGAPGPFPSPLPGGPPEGRTLGQVPSHPAPADQTIPRTMVALASRPLRGDSVTAYRSRLPTPKSARSPGECRPRPK